jgi:hypothetical protein
MFSHRKPFAALAGLAVALAVALPAATASAATSSGPTVDPQVCTLLSIAEGPFGPTQFFGGAFGGASLGNVLQHAGSTVNCPAPAPQPSWPTIPLPSLQPIVHS